MRRIVCILCFVTLCVLVVAAQQPTAPGSPAQASQAIRGATKLVIEEVTVKDKGGKPIGGLSASDFILTEDGVPQTISFVEFQQLQAAVNSAELTPSPGSAVPTAPPVTQMQIAPEPPGDSRYRNHRLLALYFDMSTMQPVDQLRAFDAAVKFIDTQMDPSVLMAVMTFEGGAVRVRQDFTGDHAQIRKAMDKLIVGLSQGFDETTSDDSASDTGAAFGQDDNEFNIFNTDRQLAALQTAAKMLGTLNEQKALIYFASGLRLNGTDNQAQLVATTNAALRSNVLLYPIDARGLVAQAPLGDATTGSPGGIGMFSGTSAQAVVTRFQRSQDTLYALAKDTGGKAMFDNNDLSLGIKQAAEAMTSYYEIGYYPTHTALDGRFHRIKISLKEEGLSANLAYRQGYFADKEFGKFTSADKERQLEDALMLENPVTDITVTMEVNYFQLNSAEYFVPVAVKIPGSELALARRGGASETLIDFIGEVKDDFGNTIQNLRDKLDIKLSDSSATQLATHPIQYETGFTLLPGKYVIKYLVRDAETGRIGTYQMPFTIPNLNKEEKRVPISSVVLGSQRVALGDSIYNVKQKINAEAANPLVLDGQKLIPSVTRVFSKSRDMYVFLQAYERDTTNIRPIVAFVSFYQGQRKAFETAPLASAQELDAKSKAVPLRFSLSLEKLPPVQYDCQVTVLDPTGQKAAFWEAPVILIP